MTANTQLKAEPKWKRALRRVLRGPRPTPFWRQHLDDQVDEVWEETGSFDPADNVFTALVLLGVGALLISALGLLVVGPLFLSPDFFSVGVADPLGRWYAAVCLASGYCDLPHLLSGTAIGLLILSLALLVLHAGMRGVFGVMGLNATRNYGEEIVQALGVLDQRLVRFRADLVLAGLVPLSSEEQEADAEDEEALVAEAQNGAPLRLLALVAFGQWLLSILLYRPVVTALGFGWLDLTPLIVLAGIVTLPVTFMVLLAFQRTAHQPQEIDPDPDAQADDPYLEHLLDEALRLTDTQRMVVAGEIERLLAEYGRPVPGYEADQ